MTNVKAPDAQMIDLLPKIFKDSLPSAATDKLANLEAGREMWLLPPLVDLCARLREPGQQQLEHSPQKVMLRVLMVLHVVIPPDTNPILENGSLLKGLRERALEDGGIYLHILGALTAG